MFDSYFPRREVSFGGAIEIPTTINEEIGDLVLVEGLG